MNNTEYHNLPRLSNSQLSAFKRQLEGKEKLESKNLIKGSFVDAILTEPDELTFEGLTNDEIKSCIGMAKEFKSNAIGKILYENYDSQIISFGEISFIHSGVEVSFETRCKFDFYKNGIGVDLKTTQSNSKKSFNNAIEFFDYDRQGAFYMDTKGIDVFWIVGVSKTKPYNVFTWTMERDDENYISGKEKYQDLMFKMFMIK